MTGKTLKVFNNGDMSRDFAYVENILDDIIRVIDKPAGINENWDSNNPDPASSSVLYKI